MNLLENLPSIITFIFLLTVLSYYLFFFIRRKEIKKEKDFSKLTVIMPAHNEGKYIQNAIKSVIKARFKGKKQIIVIDDGSIDDTYNKAIKFKSKDIEILKTKHNGKAASINKAVSMAKGDIIAIVDADSEININSIELMTEELEKKNVAAATGIVKVKNRKKFICMWVHIEQLYNSLIRLLFSKINANVVTPGPLSMYRKKEVMQVGGFSTKGFSEDIDITIRLIRKGYKIGFSEKAVAETNMPYDVKGFLRQRTRFARGMLNIFKRHLQVNNTIIDIYTLPLFVFAYMQAVIMGSITFYQIINGYLTYYVSQGIFINLNVANYFINWLTIVGFVKWTGGIFTGTTPLSFLSITGVAAGLLSYPLYFYSIYKFDKKFDLRHIVPIIFMAPFWWLIMIIYILSLPEYFIKHQYNIWKKNE